MSTHNNALSWRHDMAPNGLSSLFNVLEKKQLMAENKLETEIVEMLREGFRNRQIENVPEHISKLRTAKDVFDKVLSKQGND